MSLAVGVVDKFVVVDYAIGFYVCVAYISVRVFV